MKKVFFIYLSVLVCMFASISDALAWANCTQDVPAGKYCKTAGTKPDCPVGCYCTGSKHAVGTSINVALSCSIRMNEAQLNASGIFFCPEYTTSNEGAKTVTDCYNPILGSGSNSSSNMVVMRQCPSGCFCVNNGQIGLPNDTLIGYEYAAWQTQCQSPAQPLSPYQQSVCNTQGWVRININNGVGGEDLYLICDREHYNNYNGYFMDEFEEIYKNSDFGGAYGRKGGEIIYFGGMSTSATGNLGMYGCPQSYPSSDSGAKTVYECYKYDANGNKVYYGANTNIVCAEGTYLPANATQCVACNVAQNQVCPGGRFEKLDKIQGLRLNCPTGKYLPANATQCSSCDESQYFCFGGIYDYNSSEDQGRIAHNGYVNMGEHHTFITCNPGKYVPANTNQCSACTGNYICPGGIFFTDATYNVDRGKKLCPYGQPNATHTACVGKSSKPSYAREHLSNVINKPAESTSVMKQKIGKNEKVVSVATEKPIADSEETKVSAKDTKKSAEIQNKIDDSKNVKSLTTEKKTDLGKENTASKQTVAEEIKASATNTEKTVEVQKDVADSKKVKSSATEKKLDLGKISAPLAPKFDRALTQRPVPVSANVQETTDINSVVHGTMNEKSEQKRPSRYR